MTIATFGVIPATLTGYVHRLSLDASTSPTDTQAAEMITDRGAEWSAILESVGVAVAAVEADATLQIHRLSRRWIVSASCGDVVRARERTITPIVESFYSEADALRVRVLERIGTLGDGQPRGAGAPNLPDSHVTRAAQIHAALRDDGRLVTRLAWSGDV